MAKRRPARKAPAIPRQSPVPPASRGSLHPIARAIAPIAVIAIVVAVVELALSALVSGTAVRNLELPAGARIALAADALAAAMAAAWVVGAVIVGLAPLRQPAVNV